MLWVFGVLLAVFVAWLSSILFFPRPSTSDKKGAKGQERSSTNEDKKKDSSKGGNDLPQGAILLAYASDRGTARSLCHKMFNALMDRQYDRSVVGDPVIADVASLTVESLRKYKVVVFFLSTGAEGKAPETARSFSHILEDTDNDFRVPRDFLKGVKFFVFGLGDPAYGENLFNKFPKDVVARLRSLGGKFPAAPVFAPTLALFQVFKAKVVKHLDEFCRSAAACCSSDSESDEEAEEQGGETIEDMEDAVAAATDTRKELLFPRLRESLTKQGYALLGSHSAVKVCRWTKAMLRGRGGCYKRTFYNIQSHRCMEMTPSVACANRCVFCWRHSTNPVTRSFTWAHDPPQFLVESSIAAHAAMIKQLKGVPDVLPEKLAEAMDPCHCALSLVGEPIIYPEINTFLQLLHARRISSFMVTNAQFPQEIASLVPVTQLYISVDAATKDELRAIDRPLHDDFWERAVASVAGMKYRQERTVFRITLVKGFNMENVAAYAGLVLQGMPDFVEVKGVTYSGVNKASPMTMKNVPYHSEVVAFCQALVAEMGRMGTVDYEIACEHEHSCCMLLGRKSKYFKNGQWHTWIDFDKFFALVAKGGPVKGEDYSTATPSWALFQSSEKGFDPAQQRVHTKGKNKQKKL